MNDGRVDDDSTAELMKYFYSHLKEGKPKDQALSLAQVERRRDPRFDHPFHWAAFQLVAQWR